MSIGRALISAFLILFYTASALGQPVESTNRPNHAVKNRPPLQPSQFYRLPLGSVHPRGWLLQQLKIQANGLSGHLDEFWPDVGPNSGWLGGTGESWERGPYFLDGLVPLAYELQDPKLIAKVQKWVNWTLEHQQPDGEIGPPKNDDWWPRMVMLKVLTQYQEATGDARVIPLMQKYFAFHAREMDKKPLFEWGKYRWQDEVLSALWLYNRTGDRSLLDFARKLQQQGYDWRSQFEHFQFTHKQTLQSLGLTADVHNTDKAMETHGVNNAMALKASPLMWLLTGDERDREGLFLQDKALDTYHRLPNGMFSSDEHYAGEDPSQGIELCAVVESMFSYEIASAVLGDAQFGDRLEKIAFNALPGTFTDDMWAHQYDQQPNQIECSQEKRNWSTNGAESNLYGLEPNFGCCTANMHQGWPKFTSSLWMATADDGLAAVAYAPSEVTTMVAGRVTVTIMEDTEYPFDSQVRLSVSPQRRAKFPLALRIPAWANGAAVLVNGRAVNGAAPGSYLRITRLWKPGDRVQLNFPLRPRVTRWFHNSVVVERGPVVYALPIQTQWRKLREHGPAADWEALPESSWNYGLIVDATHPEQTIKPVPRSAEASPFSLAGARVKLEVKGRLVPRWQVEQGSAGPLPESPVTSTEPVTTLELVPYAAAKLRITAFPQVN